MSANAYKSVVDALDPWRQGDYTFDQQYSVHIADVAIPLTAASNEAKERLTEQEIRSGDTLSLLSEGCEGIVMLSQTCDIVRDPQTTPLVQVCALVRVSAEDVERAKKWQTSNYLFIPGLEAECMLGDLSRCFSVEKSVVKNWHRNDGCLTEKDMREMAVALERKVGRFAFPDEMGSVLAKFKRKINEKFRSPESPEGNCLRALSEIRVLALPSWAAPIVHMHFYFILLDSAAEKKTEVEAYLSKWIGHISVNSRYSVSGAEVTHPSQITAAKYLASDRLDMTAINTPFEDEEYSTDEEAKKGLALPAK